MSGQPPLPAPLQPQQQSAFTFAQATQVAPYVPPDGWTEEALLDYHAKLLEIGKDNNRVFENQQKRMNYQAWGGIGLIAGIIGFGCYLTATGNAFGKDIIGGTVMFLAGFLAGKGEAKSH